MANKTDQDIQSEAQGLLDRAKLPLAVDVNNGRIRATGLLDSREEYQAALDLIKSVEGANGIEDEIEVTTTAPDSAFDDEGESWGFEYAENPAIDLAADPEIEGDLTGDVGAGASDFQQAVEEAEPYFPPTDPVVAPSDDEQELEIVGGFQDSSMDELAEDPELDSDEDAPTSPVDEARDDETVREDIERELRQDALTADLDLEVEVVRGVAILRGNVISIDDAVNAEEVARRVPGVVDVSEETTLEQ